MRPDTRLLLQAEGAIGFGGNGGFQALNAVAYFGAAPILLVGLDMTVAHGLHWHGPHHPGLSNPRAQNVANWRRAKEGAAARLKNLGIAAVNWSPISPLEEWKRYV